MKAILLARVSTEEQESNTAQTNRLKTFANTKGFDQFDIYEIDGWSTISSGDVVYTVTQNSTTGRITVCSPTDEDTIPRTDDMCITR